MKKKNKRGRVNLSALVSGVMRQRREMHRQDVEEVVRFLRHRIIELLAEGRRVELRGFGSFSRRQRFGYMGRNPRDGKEIYVSNRSVLHFKPAKEMRERVDSL